MWVCVTVCVGGRGGACVCETVSVCMFYSVLGTLGFSLSGGVD